jgi:hypothetical protein
MMPLIIKLRDLETLTYFAKQPTFYFTKKDFSSFFSQCVDEKWVQGLKTLLASPAAH